MQICEDHLTAVTPAIDSTELSDAVAPLEGDYDTDLDSDFLDDDDDDDDDEDDDDDLE